MTIRAYNDAEFHAKVREIASLDDTGNIGYVISNDWQDLRVENIFAHPHHLTSQSSKKTASFIKRFFNENGFRVTAHDLPYLETITRYMERQGDTTLSALYRETYLYYNPISRLPVECLEHIATTNQLFLSLRATCRKFAHSLGITKLCSVKKAPLGNIFDISIFTRLAYKLTKHRQTEKAHHIVEQFLYKATSEAQESFWGNFSHKRYKTLKSLFDQPFDLVTTLFFRAQLCTQNMAQLFSRVITSCPNLQKLHMLGFGSGTFPKNLLVAIVNSEQLTVLDIPNFFIQKPEQVLSMLTSVPKLERLHLKILYRPEIQEYIVGNGTLFSGLSLEFEKEIPSSDEIEKLFGSCPNLQSFYLNRTNLLSLVPSGVKSLEIQLPGNDRDFEIISWLKEVRLPYLEALSITGKDYPIFSLNTLLKSVMHFKNLRSLKIGECKVDNLPHVLQRLTVLARRLDILQISIDVHDFNCSEEISLNKESQLTKLILQVALDNTTHPFKQLHSIFCACNPKKFYFEGQMPGDEDFYFKLQSSDDAFVELTADCAKMKMRYTWPIDSRLEEIVFWGAVDLDKNDKVALPKALFDGVDQMGYGELGLYLLKQGAH